MNMYHAGIARGIPPVNPLMIHQHKILLKNIFYFVEHNVLFMCSCVKWAVGATCFVIG
jgi:hypothetical protein